MDKRQSQKKSKTELAKELAEKKISLRNIRFGAASTKAKNVKEYANIKKEIARIKTMVRNMN